LHQEVLPTVIDDNSHPYVFVLNAIANTVEYRANAHRWVNARLLISALRKIHFAYGKCLPTSRINTD